MVDWWKYWMVIPIIVIITITNLCSFLPALIIGERNLVVCVQKEKKWSNKITSQLTWVQSRFGTKKNLSRFLLAQWNCTCKRVSTSNPFVFYKVEWQSVFVWDVSYMNFESYSHKFNDIHLRIPIYLRFSARMSLS